MSIRIMSFVWDNGPAKINHRMVLLALADFANDDGTCWPSIATICRKTTLSERTVQGCIRDLETEGWLRRVLGGGNQSSRYTITPAGYAPVHDTHPRTMRTAPPQDVPPTPAPRAPKPSITINEPSEVLAKKPKRKPEVPLPDNWVPSDKNIADAEARQFSAKEISNEAERFRDHHIAKGSLFRDWDAAWRTWLGNARKYHPVAGTAKPFGNGHGASIASIVAQRRLAGIV